MTKDTAEKFKTVEEIGATVTGQIGALKALVIHLLCTSTLNVALANADTDFAGVAAEFEEIIRKQIASAIKGQSPEAISAALRVQDEILAAVRSQMEKEARLLKMVANKAGFSQ
jgi:hypothetical protein